MEVISLKSGRKVKVYHVIGERPAHMNGVAIPLAYHIFNAPRPLWGGDFKGIYGTEGRYEWQGDFIHGIFFVAVSPDDHERIEQNRSLDGWILVYHTQADVIRWAKEYYEREYPDRINWSEYDDDEIFDMARIAFHREHNEQEV